nr:hypothetical protein [Tanacetum cinerariifolium]
VCLYSKKDVSNDLNLSSKRNAELNVGRFLRIMLGIVVDGIDASPDVVIVAMVEGVIIGVLGIGSKLSSSSCLVSSSSSSLLPSLSLTSSPSLPVSVSSSSSFTSYSSSSLSSSSSSSSSSSLPASALTVSLESLSLP